MRTFLTILSFVIVTNCNAQKASFKELKLKPNTKFYSTKEQTIIFPIVTTKYGKIDSLINAQIKNEVLQPDDENQSLRKALLENINEYGLTDVSYEITYNNNNFLSFSIFSQGCAAYCSSTNTYFNFDLSTGKKIPIDDVILKSKIDSFKNVVWSDKITCLNKYKIEEKKITGSDGIDSSDYNWIISEIDSNCINQISIETFSVSSNSIEILDPCTFPHVIRSQEPEIELKYTFSSIEKFLTPRFKKLLK